MDLGQDLHDEQVATPRLFKSHQPPSTVNVGGKYIFTLRNPVNAWNSDLNFNIAKGRLEEGTNLLEFMETPFFKRFGLPIEQFYHEQFLIRENVDKVLLVCYEKLLSDFDNQLNRIAKFMGVSELSEEKIKEIKSTTSKIWMLQNVTKFDDHFIMEKQKLNPNVKKIMEYADKVVSKKGKEILTEEAMKMINNRWKEVFGKYGINCYAELILYLENEGLV